MARVPRHRRAPGSLEPGQSYHVTNRGVDRGLLFASDRDRLVFLSLLAEACLEYGVVCHAWTLMSNHFHLAVEDARGMLSQMMHRLAFCYARYFNDTRLPRRTGPLFESRFGAELIDSPACFENAVAYVLLNPLRTAVSMARSAEAYRWSSAALVCSQTTPEAFAAGLLAPLGGIDGVLRSLPPASTKASRRRRRGRLEMLASGAWMQRECVLAGRSPKLYRRMLAARLACEPPPACDQVPRSAQAVSAASAPAFQIEAELRRARFGGLAVDETIGAIARACRGMVPASLAEPVERWRDVLAYALWRFTSASVERLASAIGYGAERFDEAVDKMRGRRRRDPGWRRLLWAIEWALRWQLRAAPHRP